jgi:hypothetical protein
MFPLHKKIRLVILFLVFSSLNHVYPQSVKWGNLQTSESSLYKPHIMGDDNNFIYSTSTVYDKIYIEKFDKNDLSRQYSKLIVRPKIGMNELVYEGIYLMKDEFVIFASYYNSAENNSNIYAYIYNADDGAKVGDPKLILTVPVEKMKRKGNFSVLVSKDRTKILINHAGYYKKEKCVKDRYLLLNNDLETITEKEEKIFKDEIDYSTFNYIIDNDGSIYYIKNMIGGESFIVSYDANKDFEKWEDHIDFSDMNRKTKIVNMHFTINAENDLVLVGYYTLDGKNLDGTFIMKIRTFSKEIVFKKINTLDKETLKKLVLSNSLQNKTTPKIWIDTYNNTEILSKNDGGIILIGESVYVYNNKSYEMRDILVMNHSADGELLWTQKIPKYQFYIVNSGFKGYEAAIKNIEYGSFFSSIQDGKLKIYLNDNSENASNAKTGKSKLYQVDACKLKKMKNTRPYCYSFDLVSGEVTTAELLPNPSDKTYFKPLVSYQKKSGSDAIFFSQYKTNYKFGILME